MFSGSEDPYGVQDGVEDGGTFWHFGCWLGGVPAVQARIGIPWGTPMNSTEMLGRDSSGTHRPVPMKSLCDFWVSVGEANRGIPQDHQRYTSISNNVYSNSLGPKNLLGACWKFRNPKEYLEIPKVLFDARTLQGRISRIFGGACWKCVKK